MSSESLPQVGVPLQVHPLTGCPASALEAVVLLHPLLLHASESPACFYLLMILNITSSPFNLWVWFLSPDWMLTDTLLER